MDTIVTLPLYKPMLKQGSVAHGNWHMAMGTWTCCRNKDQDARKGYNLSPITYKIRKSPSLGTFYKRLASCLSKMSGSGLSWWLRGEESTVKAEDRGSIPGPGRPPRPGAATPACHSYYARLREPGSHSHWPRDCWSPRSAEPVLRNRRSRRKETPAHRRGGAPPHRGQRKPGRSHQAQHRQGQTSKQKFFKNVRIGSNRGRQCNRSVMMNSKRRRKLKPVHKSGCNLNQRESNFLKLTSLE